MVKKKKKNCLKREKNTKKKKVRKEKEIVIELNEKKKKETLNFPVMQNPSSGKISFIVSWIFFIYFILLNCFLHI